MNDRAELIRTLLGLRLGLGLSLGLGLRLIVALLTALGLISGLLASGLLPCGLLAGVLLNGVFLAGDDLLEVLGGLLTGLSLGLAGRKKRKIKMTFHNTILNNIHILYSPKCFKTYRSNFLPDSSIGFQLDLNFDLD